MTHCDSRVTLQDSARYIQRGLGPTPQQLQSNNNSHVTLQDSARHIQKGLGPMPQHSHLNGALYESVVIPRISAHYKINGPRADVTTVTIQQQQPRSHYKTVHGTHTNPNVLHCKRCTTKRGASGRCQSSHTSTVRYTPQRQPASTATSSNAHQRTVTMRNVMGYRSIPHVIQHQEAPPVTLLLVNSSHSYSRQVTGSIT